MAGERLFSGSKAILPSANNKPKKYAFVGESIIEK